MTLYRFTLNTKPHLYVEVELDGYARPAFDIGRAELVEMNHGEPVSFADVTVTRPREMVPVRLVGAGRNAEVGR